jgi:AdoMet-dependent heme synthase
MGFNELKYFIAKITKTSSYLDSINDNFLDKLLGHHKIIGWWRGHPVYSSFLVPGLSKPLGNLIATNMIKSMTEKTMPGIVNIGITDKCNCKCKHCSFYGAMDDMKSKQVLSKEELKKTIDDCLDLGVTVINFVGGEPLINRNLPELIKYINKNKAISSIYTNGWFLKEFAKPLKDAGLLQVNVSIDSINAEAHDKFRVKRGLFKKAVEGIKECQRYGLLTCISTTVTQESLKNGDFEKMIVFAKKMKVNELIVLDMMSAGMYSHLYTKKEKVDRNLLFKIVEKYNKRKDFPGIFCYARIRDEDLFGCSAGRNYFYISPYGDVNPCDFSCGNVGNCTKIPLKTLWSRLVELKKKKEFFNPNCASCGSCN